MEYHVIGGGPVGFAVALLLAKRGLRSIVYEARVSLYNDLEESYPIGINPRTFETLETIHPDLAARARKTGELVDSWQIFAGSRRVALLPSGMVYGTTRGEMNFILYEAAQKNELIQIKFNHKLVEVDFKAQELTFETSSGSIKVKAFRVIGADGVNSNVRRQMSEKIPGFVATRTPWTNEFRVLFGEKDRFTAPDIDPKVHYIFSGCYSSTVSNGEARRGTVVLGARDDASEEERRLLLSSDGNAENVKSLRRFMQKKVPLMMPFFPDDQEFSKYFSRRTFRGSIIRCNRLNVDDWVCLVGDAGHSVFPAIGEGFNSGMEDALILTNIIAVNTDHPFSAFNQERLPDVHALGEYALHANDLAPFGGEKVARTMFLATRAIAKKIGVVSTGIDDYLFGPLSSARRPYREIVKEWKLQKFVFLNFSRIICYPLYAIYALVIFVVRVLLSIFGKTKKN